MSSSGQLLLIDAHAALERRLQERPQTDLLLIFAYWINPQPAQQTEAQTLAAQAVLRSGAQQDFQTVAAMGFALHGGWLSSEATDVLRQGLTRLAGRNPFLDGTPMPFCADAVGLLGIAVGCSALGDPILTKNIHGWFAQFLKVIHDSSGIEDWQRIVFHAVDSLLGGSVGIPVTLTENSLDARAGLTAKGFLPPLGEAEEATALRFIATNSLQPIPLERAALRLAAFNWLVRTAAVVVPERLTVDSVLRLLERVPAGLRNWTWETTPRTGSGEARQWHIDHEYHVQNLLWLLLSPIFPDLDDEQYLAKIGRKNPRADFYIPSLKLIVEVKFLRASDKTQKVIDEIAADLSLYRAMGNECEGVIPFIWDDSARTNEHDYLRQGLKKMLGVVDVVVVSRPSNWTNVLAALAQSKALRKRKR